MNDFVLTEVIREARSWTRRGLPDGAFGFIPKNSEGVVLGRTFTSAELTELDPRLPVLLTNETELEKPAFIGEQIWRTWDYWNHPVLHLPARFFYADSKKDATVAIAKIHAVSTMKTDARRLALLVEMFEDADPHGGPPRFLDASFKTGKCLVTYFDRRFPQWREREMVAKELGLSIYERHVYMFHPEVAETPLAPENPGVSLCL